MDISLSSSPGSACCPLSVSGMVLCWSGVQLGCGQLCGDREKSNSQFTPFTTHGLSLGQYQGGSNQF